MSTLSGRSIIIENTTPSGSGSGSRKLLFIAIGSHPDYFDRRQEIRDTWLQWRTAGIDYAFFTDYIPATNGREDDLISLDTPTTRGMFGLRGRRILEKISSFIDDYEYLLRVDDDGFICLPRLVEILRSAENMDVWGRYWTRRGKRGKYIGMSRIDENFMLIRSSIASMLAVLVGSGLVQYDDEITFAANFGFISNFLNISIVNDDYLDTQQGYRAGYMHVNGSVGYFCRDYVYSHHVYGGNMRKVYELYRDGGGHGMNGSIRHREIRYRYESRKFSRKLKDCICGSTIERSEIVRSSGIEGGGSSVDVGVEGVAVVATTTTTTWNNSSTKQRTQE